MKDTELVAALRKMKVNTRGCACFGCAYAKNCVTNGCYLIEIAADRLSIVDSALFSIKVVCEASDAVLQSTLRDVIAILDPEYVTLQEKPDNMVLEREHDFRKRVLDFERCADTGELAVTLRCIDDNGYCFLGVTQDGTGVYTVLFRRPARE